MIYLVKHYDWRGEVEKLTAHTAIHFARSSAKGRRSEGVEIFVVDESNLTLVERRGIVEPQQIPGQDPLFQIP